MVMRLVLLRLRQCMLLLSNCRADLSCSIHYVLFKFRILMHITSLIYLVVSVSIVFLKRGSGNEDE